MIFISLKQKQNVQTINRVIYKQNQKNSLHYISKNKRLKKKKRKDFFDPKKNKRYCGIFTDLQKYAESINYILQPSDFGFVKYYRDWVLLKKTPVIPIYIVSKKDPLFGKKTYLERQKWRILQKKKIILVKVFHFIFLRWYTNWLAKRTMLRSKEYRFTLFQIKQKIFQKKTQFTLKAKKTFLKFRKRAYLKQKRNKPLMLFRACWRNKSYEKFRYQLRLLQKHFLIYLDVTLFFFKKLYRFYKQFSQYSVYEKFFLCFHHRISIMLTKLKYFLQFELNQIVCKKLILSGGVCVNGNLIKNLYFNIWPGDLLEVSYYRYYFEWLYFYFLKQLLYFKWNGKWQIDPFKTFKPYLQKTKKIRQINKNWFRSSRYFPGAIVTKLVVQTKERGVRMLPKFYNFLNLQIIAEIMPLQKF